LLAEFWLAHDPARPAWSRQYRAVVLCANEEQYRAALDSQASVFAQTGAMHTAVERLGEFTLAEEYHQKYYLRQRPGLLQVFLDAGYDDAALRDSTAAAGANAAAAGAVSCSG